jgi:hypothetical protein
VGARRLEIVYGYFFNVWTMFNQELTARAGMSMNTKFGEMILFAFLSITSFLVSISASLIKAQPSLR